jgi:hypothetical protein
MPLELKPHQAGRPAGACQGMAKISVLRELEKFRPDVKVVRQRAVTYGLGISECMGDVRRWAAAEAGAGRRLR